MSDSEWVRPLSIPGIALPGLRDLRIQFIALLEWDLVLGPVAYINEISRGSSYIKKLQSYHTLSEVYAGVARSPQRSISTLEEDIAVFRHEPEVESDIVIVLFISCLSGSNLEPVRELGQKALFRSKGKPELIGRELSLCLREKLTYDKKFKSVDKKYHLTIWDENRPKKPLDLNFIRGLAIYDLESKIADVRNLPRWINGKEIIPKVILEFVDNQLQSIIHGAATSMLYQNIPFLATKVMDKDIYIIVYIHDSGLFAMKKISEWLNPFVEVIGNDWKHATQNEILAGISIFDQAEKRNTPENYRLIYARMLFRCDRIKPSKGKAREINIDPPMHLDQEIWQKFDTLSGKLTLSEIATSWKLDLIDVVTLFEWARVRKLVVFLQK